MVHLIHGRTVPAGNTVYTLSADVDAEGQTFENVKEFVEDGIHSMIRRARRELGYAHRHRTNLRPHYGDLQGIHKAYRFKWAIYGHCERDDSSGSNYEEFDIAKHWRGITHSSHINETETLQETMKQYDNHFNPDGNILQFKNDSKHYGINLLAVTRIVLTITIQDPTRGAKFNTADEPFFSKLKHCITPRNDDEYCLLHALTQHKILPLKDLYTKEDCTPPKEDMRRKDAKLYYNTFDSIDDQLHKYGLEDLNINNSNIDKYCQALDSNIKVYIYNKKNLSIKLSPKEFDLNKPTINLALYNEHWLIITSVKHFIHKDVSRQSRINTCEYCDCKFATYKGEDLLYVPNKKSQIHIDHEFACSARQSNRMTRYKFDYHRSQFTNYDAKSKIRMFVKIGRAHV